MQSEIQERGSRQVVRWEKPERGVLKVNVDAAKVKEVGTRLGLVARDEEGRFVLAVVKRTRVSWEPELTEAQALLWAVRLISVHARRPTLLETDFHSLIQKLDRGEEIETKVGVVVNEIRELRLERGEIRWRFWGRGGNGAADEMARAKCKWEETKMWVDMPLVYILQTLMKDCNGNLPP
ncbi:unnamed protein product [Linum trigynum]|uniref:RNase H type-1 domain-containing protein n=1 Tax=Linum trigynum TaxID=586398 RepID=A0AAV2ET44_9ROSI